MCNDFTIDDIDKTYEVVKYLQNKGRKDLPKDIKDYNKTLSLTIMMDKNKRGRLEKENGIVSVDYMVSPILDILNSNGVKTVMSCDGHFSNKMYIDIEGKVDPRVFEGHCIDYHYWANRFDGTMTKISSREFKSVSDCFRAIAEFTEFIENNIEGLKIIDNPTEPLGYRIDNKGIHFNDIKFDEDVSFRSGVSFRENLKLKALLVLSNNDSNEKYTVFREKYGDDLTNYRNSTSYFSAESRVRNISPKVKDVLKLLWEAGVKDDLGVVSRVLEHKANSVNNIEQLVLEILNQLSYSKVELEEGSVILNAYENMKIKYELNVGGIK